eukprot:TRINITY_DN3349_c0_g1_i1.p2 TRINITY_DN3349_c0_g1~~TRINITY_DN3349_c0_g1_i1.p2  ORF type:complete len:95 (+),score=2.32 TRINITY_DN3349_c0_g1_i1:51-335(+)
MGEECTALANRVGIMVAGNLRCIGTTQHLRSRFGKGYELNMNLEADKADELAKLSCGSLECPDQGFRGLRWQREDPDRGGRYTARQHFPSSRGG